MQARVRYSNPPIPYNNKKCYICEVYINGYWKTVTDYYRFRFFAEMAVRKWVKKYREKEFYVL